MLEELKKYRELAVFVLLGAAALRLLAQLIGAFLYDDGRGLNFLYGARIIGISVLDPLLAIALVAFVAWCARDKTRNARLLALGALIVVGVGTLFGFLYLVLGLGGPGSNKFFGFLADLTQLVIPALLVFVLWRVFQSLPAPQPAQRPGPPQLPPGYPQGYQQVPGQPGPQQQPGPHQQGPQQPGPQQQGQQQHWGGWDQQPGSQPSAPQSAQPSGPSSAPGPQPGQPQQPGQQQGPQQAGPQQPGLQQPGPQQAGQGTWQPQHSPNQPYSPTQPAYPGQHGQLGTPGWQQSAPPASGPSAYENTGPIGQPGPGGWENTGPVGRPGGWEQTGASSGPHPGSAASGYESTGPIGQPGPGGWEQTGPVAPSGTADPAQHAEPDQPSEPAQHSEQSHQAPEQGPVDQAFAQPAPPVQPPVPGSTSPGSTSPGSTPPGPTHPGLPGTPGDQPSGSDSRQAQPNWWERPGS